MNPWGQARWKCINYDYLTTEPPTTTTAFTTEDTRIDIPPLKTGKVYNNTA